MDKELLLKYIKEDDQSLLALDGLKYGIYYKGSYWTGSTPLESFKSLYSNYPRFRLKKNETLLPVYRMVERIPGIFCVDIIAFNYSLNEIKELRKKIKA